MNQKLTRYEQPTPPPDLVQACVAGECVLFGGAGLSAQADLPTYQPLVQDLLQWCVKHGFIPYEGAVSHREALELGQVGTVADLIVDVVGDKSDLLNRHLRSIFLTRGRGKTAASAGQKNLPQAHQMLRRIPFTSVMTPNFDNLLEETFAERHARVYTFRSANALLDAHSKREFFILKLYGRLEEPDTIMLAPAQFADAIRENLDFAQFMETVFFSRTILFVSASLEGIEDYLTSVSLRRLSTNRPHYALVGVTNNAWQAKASQLEKRYGIRVLPFTPSPGYPEVVGFLQDLAFEVEDKTSPGGGGAFSTPGEIADPGVTVGHLKQVVLDNMGPFEHLELDLDPKWNILLGDNGVGKSTILKAIAVALVGKDAQAFAGRVVKLGPAQSGTIVLKTDRETYHTEIKNRGSGDVAITSTPGRPLEAEGWLAIGFPPLRTMSWERPKSPEAREVKKRPSPDDLMPLIVGSADPRMDKLKQWIVNLDYWNLDEQRKRKESRKGHAEAGRYDRLLNDFFSVVGSMTEGLKVERGKVNAETHEVTVITDDGEMPFELVSQGTTSLIGWVGILLQRLYEIYPEQHDPKKCYALVLMDEIDAHLHPTWQQSLVYKLGEIFPNVQFIATTHSPLIVGGLPAEQVLRFVRDEEGKVVRLPVEPEMTVGRADQILTGGLFGLKTTLDTITQTEMEQYKRLLGKRKRTPTEEADFQRVRKILQFRIPMSAETPDGRRGQTQARDEQVREVRVKLSGHSAAGEKEKRPGPPGGGGKGESKSSTAKDRRSLKKK
jgi:energy-coupling factor transporter ATP-binding protein EcfA2